MVTGSEAAKFTARTDLIDRGSIQNGSNILQRPALHMAHMSSFGLIIVIADAAAALREEVQKPRRSPAGHDRPTPHLPLPLQQLRPQLGQERHV